MRSGCKDRGSGLHGDIPTWNDYVEHPDYDDFCRRQTLIPHIKDVKVPTLNVAGWWDTEDFYGPIRIYSALEEHDTDNLNYLVVGPWRHGGWSAGEGDELGDIGFGSATGVHFRNEIQAPWFAALLKDQGQVEMPEALTFESGTNRWRHWPSWPPAEAEATALYFAADEQLSLEKPALDVETAFLKGHRIMVQVQSTWFPIIDRNPQTFVPNIFKATESDFQKATHRIHRSPERASRVTIPIVRR